jgi:hypothetical protein
LQRIDVIYARHPSNDENSDTTSAPLLAVAKGIGHATSPAVPAIPTGALELARNTMTSAATTTLSSGNTITQTAPLTGPRGAPCPVRSDADRDALLVAVGATADSPLWVEHVAGSRFGVVERSRNGGTTWAQFLPSWRPVFAQVTTATVVADATVLATLSIPAGALASTILLSFVGQGGFAAGASALRVVITTSAGTLVSMTDNRVPAGAAVWTACVNVASLSLAAGTAATVTFTADSDVPVYWRGIARADRDVTTA